MVKIFLSIMEFLIEIFRFCIQISFSLRSSYRVCRFPNLIWWFLGFFVFFIQANTLRLYLTCIRNTMEAAMCLQVTQFFFWLLLLNGMLMSWLYYLSFLECWCFFGCFCYADVIGWNVVTGKHTYTYLYVSVGVFLAMNLVYSFVWSYYIYIIFDWCNYFVKLNGIYVSCYMYKLVINIITSGVYRNNIHG